MTLIRLIRAMPGLAVTTSPRVLGVDEFALRKGHSYGTLLVDRDPRPIDILAERSSESFAAWLAARPGTELICRDRAGCYADGGVRGAPDAVQVADRWHLWHNLGEAVERGGQPAPRTPGGSNRAAPCPAATTAPAPAVPRTGRIADRTRTWHAAVHRLLAGGRGITEIAAELGLLRNTIRRLTRAASPEELLTSDGTGRRASILDEYAPYLRQRWNSGCTNAALLWREIRARGYRGSHRQVRGYLAHFRGSAVIPAPAPAPLKPKAVTTWIMTRPDRLADGDKASLDAILAASRALAAVTASVRDFAAIMTKRRGRKRLESWMTAALATGEPALCSFVTGLRADQDAVTNGLSLPWSSGAVEGHVNRIKMLKRQSTDARNPTYSAAESS